MPLDAETNSTTPDAGPAAGPHAGGKPQPSNQPATDSDGGCACGHDTAQHGAEPAQAAAPGTDASEELDVRTLPHGARHEIIFARLDALAPGGALVIVNDHDPKPLRYQISALWPDQFEWTYRQAGPHVWQVAITRAG